MEYGDVRISHFRDGHKDLVPFFVMEDDLVYCNDISGLIQSLNIMYDS